MILRGQDRFQRAKTWLDQAKQDLDAAEEAWNASGRPDEGEVPYVRSRALHWYGRCARQAYEEGLRLEELEDRLKGLDDPNWRTNS
jgi:hypothetical protein